VDVVCADAGLLVHVEYGATSVDTIPPSLQQRVGSLGGEVAKRRTARGSRLEVSFPVTATAEHPSRPRPKS
jgi:hypothetical protein